MSPESNHSIWLEELQQGDGAAFERLWKDYFAKIVRYAGRKMNHLRLRAADEEDVALSAMNSFCQMVQKRDEPISDSTELWKLLATITRRKVNKERQRQFAGKRQEIALAGESVFGPRDESNGNVTSIGIGQVEGKEPPPHLALELVETLEKIMSLPHADPIVQHRLDGLSNSAIAEQLGCSTRTIQRSIERIESEWNLWLQQIQNEMEKT
jgi:DNA-directed RNA polymerase specialized sigma24 family protein